MASRPSSLSPALPAGAGRCYRLISTYSLGLVPEAFAGTSREMKAAAGAVRAGRGEGRRGLSQGGFQLGFGEHSFEFYLLLIKLYYLTN